MPKPKNGAELLKLLKESGTPDGPLAHGRDHLRKVRDEGGAVADVASTVAALAAALGEDHGTVGKALALAETGELPRPKAAGVPIEDELLAEAAPEKPAGGAAAKAK